ncbi:uncharacterized protein RJT21DRAFT_3272 [Scheffersomyces amazonensis]|uniref:uncharacterized protein n=1 Tax=Scheffersomyces amazonensis TaxID=1078765 RepID=UPI00315DBAE5
MVTVPPPEMVVKSTSGSGKWLPFDNSSLLGNAAKFIGNTVSIFVNFALHLYVNSLIFEVMVVFKIRRWINSSYKKIIYFHLYLLELVMIINLMIIGGIYSLTGTIPEQEQNHHQDQNHDKGQLYNEKGWLKISSVHDAYWKNLDIEFKRRYSSKATDSFLAPLTLFIDIKYSPSNSSPDEFKEVICPIVDDKLTHLAGALIHVDPLPSVLYDQVNEEPTSVPVPVPVQEQSTDPIESPVRHHFSFHRKSKRSDTINDASSTFTVETN